MLVQLDRNVWVNPKFITSVVSAYGDRYSEILFVNGKYATVCKTTKEVTELINNAL